MARRGTSKTHTGLLIELSNACDTDTLTKLKTHAKAKEFGGIRAGELEKLVDMGKLMDKLEKKRIFKQGCYDKLKELFELVEFTEGTELIEEFIMEQNAEGL